MWSEFPVAERYLWLEKLQREASKTLNPELDAATALTYRSPDGIDYRPIYQRTSSSPVPCGWEPTRFMQTIEPSHPEAGAQIEEALAHDCCDFYVTRPYRDPYRDLHERFPQARWWIPGPPDAALPTPYAWELDAMSVHLADTAAETWTLSTRSVREQGGSMASELWIGLCAWVELHRLGLLPKKGSLGWTTAISPHILLESAKCTAIRKLFSKFCAAAGLEISLHLHAAQAVFYTSLLDEETNLLRSAATAWVATLAGCQTVRLEAYGGAARAAHLARNQLHLMNLEGYLQKVSDPLAGAYALEEWSEQLARDAWNRMRSVEASGGLAKFIAAGHAGGMLERELVEQRRQLDSDEKILVGVTRYTPLQLELNDEPCVDGRLAAPFEDIRREFARLEGVAAAIIIVGAAARLTPRIDFARNFLALAGLSPTQQTDEDGWPTQSIVVLCSSDAEHGRCIPQCLQSLQNGQALVVAGNPDLEGNYIKIYKGVARSHALHTLLKAVAP